jgi:hypothetical protein
MSKFSCPRVINRTALACICSMFAMAMMASQANAQVSVTATAGTVGPTPYTTVKLAFDAINAGTHQGAVTVAISANTTEGTTPATLNSNGAGSALYTSVLVQPSVDGVSISGNPVTGFGVIQLNGADNVTIDGDNPNTGGTNRNLTVNNTTTATVIANSAIRIATSTAVTSADNNTIKNCNLNGNVTGGNSSLITSTTGSSNSSFAIYCGGKGGATAVGAPTAITSVTADTAPSGTTINNLLIDNNAVNQAARAIVFNGAATTVSTGVTISNNVLGDQGTATPAVPPFTSPATTVYTKGIWVAGTASATVSGNSFKNIMSYVATATTAIEMVSPITASTISNNTINTMGNNNTSGSAVKAILVSASATSYAVRNNTISNIQVVSGASGTDAIEATAAVAAAGGIIELNNVSKVYNRSTGTFGVYGINVTSGNGVVIKNNVVSDLLFDMTSGAAFSTTFGMYGIRIAGGTNHKIYHNSVNMNAALPGTANTTLLSTAFGITSTTVTGLDIRNNIWANTTSGGTTSIAHVSFYLPTNTASAMTLTNNNNAYFSGTDTARQGIGQANTTPGTGFYLAANFNPAATTPATNLRALTTILGTATNDNASQAYITAAPFTSPTNLHIPAATNTQLESGGASAGSTGVTTDIDGDTRPGPTGSVNGGATAPDIGADEFDGSPAASMTYVSSTTTQANTSNVPANTTTQEVIGIQIVTSGSTSPLSVTSFSLNTNGTTSVSDIANAKLWSTGTTNAFATTTQYGSTVASPSGPFGFTGSLTLSAGTNYFWLTYDTTCTAVVSNVIDAECNSLTVVSAQTPTVQAPAGSRTIVAGPVPLNGTYTVGSGGTYPTLTAAVADLNAGGLAGNTTFSILSNTTEPASVVINEWRECSGSNFTLLIKPAAATTPTITGNTASAVIVLNGADRVTIDGSVGSTVNTVCPVSAASRDMTITNTNAGTASAVVWLQNTATGGANNNTIMNCNLVGSGNAQTIIALGSGSSTIGSPATVANNNNSYINNNISKTAFGIYSGGVSAAVKNTGTVINQNLINTAAPNNINRNGISVVFDDGVVVSGNNISEIVSAISADALGITLGSTAIANSITTGADVTNATVTKNVIGSVRQTNTFSAGGIFVASVTTGTTLISDNMISGVSANGTLGDFGVGIFAACGTGSTTRVYYNTVTMVGTQTGGSQANFALAIAGSNPIVDVRNNILVNTQSTGTGNNYAIGYGYSTFTNLTSDHNDYYVTSPGSGFFIGATASISAPTSQLTVLALQTATGKDSAAQNVLPVFVSASDLHLNASGNASLDGTATTVSKVDDIDCQTRDVSTPDIGADEFTGCVPPTATVAPAGPIALCAPATQLLTASTSASSPTYQWKKNGVNIGGATLSTLTVSTSGSYTVFIVDTSTGCNNTSNAVVVTVNPVVSVSASATPSTICPNGSSQLNAIASQISEVNTYVLSSLTGQTYAPLSGAGITTINTDAQLTSGFATGNQDDGGVLITLPFTFTYGVNTFTQMSMCTNGWVAAGNLSTIAAADSRAAGNLFTATTPNNTIAAWFKDMGANFPLGTGSMRHGLIGTDVYAFQWNNAVGSSFSDGSTITISFQVNIYGPASSAPGTIDIIYGPTAGAIAFGASEGIEDAVGGTNHYLNALTGNGTSTTTSTVWPGNGNGYRLAPTTFTYSWSPVTFLSNPNIANPVASGVTATTPYTVTATAASGCSNTANVTVTVSDTTLPVISGCPADIGPVNNDAGLCTAVVTWTAPTAGDNCSVASFVSDHNPGDAFPVGDTLVTYTATDGSGNVATCTFHVVVADVENPTLTGCPADISQNTDLGQPYATVTWTPPTPADNCPGVTMTSNHNPGDQFLCGSTAVNYTAHDVHGHDSAVCTFTVTVTDAEFPTFTSCPTTIMQNTDAGLCTATVTWATPTATDNKGTPIVAQTEGPISGSSFPKGSTHVKFTATDPQSNVSVCEFDVIVSDAEIPTVVGCPSSVTTNSNTPVCSAVVTWIEPTAADNCPGSTIAQVLGPVSGSTFAPGVTTIKYRATDTSSNVSVDCVFTVTVTPTPDVNNDGNVDLNDVAPFTNVLLGLDTDPLHMVRADANCDGFDDGLDIAPFIDAILP